jgi:trimeric autotransporter adhesin
VNGVSPATVSAGATDTTLTLSGSGFTSSTTVALNGVAEPTSYVSATQVKATIPAAQLATAATLALTATNGGGSSPSPAATFTVNNPAPVVTSLSAQSITAGSTSPTITVTGTGFVSSSNVLVNGSSHTTSFTSSTQLSFKPTIEDIALPGTLAITVSNAAPGGGTSAAVNITVTAESPAITSTSPNSILAGSADTTITITGTNFFSTSVAMIGTTALPTTYVSSTKLTAVIPAASIASLGWLPLTVRTPSASSPSATVAIPVAMTLPLNANHIVYDPYNRKLWVTIGTTTSTLAGNSLVSIDPATGAIGTPVALSGTPYAIALSDSGKTLYALTSTSVVRYDMTTSTVSSASVPGVGGSVSIATQSLSIAPGTENELVLGTTSFSSTDIQVYDYDPSANTVTARLTDASMPYHYGFCPVFLNSDYLINPYNSVAEIDLYPVTSTGLAPSSATYTTSSNQSGCMKIAGNVGYSTTGNVYAFVPTSITKTATINLSPTSVLAYFGTPVAPDLSLHQVFFGTVISGNGPESLTSASTDTNLLNSIVTLPTSSVTSGGHFYYSDDLFRWGPDGLTLLLRDDLGTGGAILYLLRGPFVVPQELNTNTAASITAVSSGTIAAGSGNTLLTLTGSNFVPGVAITWNGSYRTTAIVDPTHVTVAIPASDLTAAGTGTLVATNPGAPASSSLTILVQ